MSPDGLRCLPGSRFGILGGAGTGAVAALRAVAVDEAAEAGLGPLCAYFMIRTEAVTEKPLQFCLLNSSSVLIVKYSFVDANFGSSHEIDGWFRSAEEAEALLLGAPP